MESQPKNPEFRNNPENFHPCLSHQSAGRTQTSLCTCPCCHTPSMDLDEKTGTIFFSIKSKTCLKRPLTNKDLNVIW